MTRGTKGRWTPQYTAARVRPALFSLMLAAAGSSVGATAGAGQDVVPGVDPRVGLAAGLYDAGSAISNLELVASIAKGVGFVHPDSTFGDGYSNTDLAFTANYAIQGNYRGFQIYDIEDPLNPTLRTAVVCPGGPRRPLRRRQPPLHLGRGPDRANRLWNARRRGLDQRRAFQRRSHFRHQRHPESPASRGRANVPRLPHTHAHRRSQGRRKRLHLRSRDGLEHTSPSRVGGLLGPRSEHSVFPHRGDSSAPRSAAGRSDR